MFSESAFAGLPYKNQKCDPLRAMKTFIRRKVGHTHVFQDSSSGLFCSWNLSN